MNKDGVWRGPLLYLILGVLIMGISLVFIFQETWFGEDSDKEVCWQSVRLRAAVPDSDLRLSSLEFKNKFSLDCKTNVVEIGESDIRDFDKARVKIGDAIAECWALYGNGDFSLFPPEFFKYSTCVPCARIHLTNEAKKYVSENEDVEINIKDILNSRMREDFTYYFYLENSGERFPALNFGSAVPFDLNGGEFMVGEDEDVYDEAKVYFEDMDSDLKVELRGDVYSFEEFERLKGVDESMRRNILKMNEVVLGVEEFDIEGGESYFDKMRWIEEILKSGEKVRMIGDWDLEEVGGKLSGDVVGEIVFEGEAVGEGVLGEAVGEGFSLEIVGGRFESGEVGKGMDGGEVYVGNGFVRNLGRGMKSGQISVESSDVVSFARGMEGGSVYVGLSDVANLAREMKGGRVDVYSGKVGDSGEDMSGGELWFWGGSLISGYVGKDIVGGNIFIEKGVEVGCSLEDCGSIDSIDDLEKCPCFFGDGVDGGMIEFVENFGEKNFVFEEDKIESDSEFCKGRLDVKKCGVIEDFVGDLGEGVYVEMKEAGERDWYVDIRGSEEDLEGGNLEAINRLNLAKVDIDFATTKISLPEKFDVDKGDLIVSYGSVVTSSEDFGNYIPYLFYFQSGQERDPYKEVKRDFVKSGLYWLEETEEFLFDKVEADSSSFCRAWEGI